MAKTVLPCCIKTFIQKLHKFIILADELDVRAIVDFCPRESAMFGSAPKRKSTSDGFGAKFLCAWDQHQLWKFNKIWSPMLAAK